MKTKNICQIGSTVFQAGVEESTIIARAEREYRYKNKCVECGTMNNVRNAVSGDKICEECANCGQIELK